MSTAVASQPAPIPLMPLPNQATSSSANRTGRPQNYVSPSIHSILHPPAANTPNSLTTLAAANQSVPSASQTTSATHSVSNVLALSPHTVATLKGRWEEFWTAANGIAVAGLVLALAFGIGAWTGMNMQYNQGEKSLQLSIWAACADHESIQNTNLCKDVLSKSFDQFQARSVEMSSETVSIVKREVELEYTNRDGSVDFHSVSRMESFLSELSPYEQLMVSPANEFDPKHMPLPEVRAAMFPLVNFLYTPIRWLFSLIERSLLVTVLLIHRIFGWFTTLTWFVFQSWLYSMAEQFVTGILRGFDIVISEMMPSFIPPFLVGGTATAVCMSLLKSYWYGLSFWECLKWNFIWRGGFVLAYYILHGMTLAYKAWRNRIKRND